MTLKGRWVLITGTVGGEDEPAQRVFAAEGARIAGCGMQEGAAQATAAALRSEGANGRGATVDLADLATTRTWGEVSVAELGFVSSPATDGLVDQEGCSWSGESFWVSGRNTPIESGATVGLG